MNVAVNFLTRPETGRQAIGFKLPDHHTYTVQSCVERAGQAAKGTVFKSATLANGTKMQVPEFVKEGDKIVVEIATKRYMRRDTVNK